MRDRSKAKAPSIKATGPRRLKESVAYRRAIGCLRELGEAIDDEDTRAQCERILDSVMELGVVIAHGDLHRRMPV